ncbi:MAG: hypothetical protein SGJ10_00935 [Bacteroidota bacterium]|nr:hypothetical protein [Bacteroidota bacterium]
MITGTTDSIGNKGGYIVKTDIKGNIKWEKTYGKTADDGFGDILQTNDGGYIFAGSRGSFNNGMLPKYHTDGDIYIYIAKNDSDGNIKWDKYFGGKYRDEGGVLKRANDGGYILLGSTWSFGNRRRIYLAKLDSNFNVFGVGICNPQGNIGHNAGKGFCVFPNPTNASINIEYNSIQKLDLTIYNTETQYIIVQKKGTKCIRPLS